VVRAQDAVGSLSGPTPPLLRVTVTQGEAPLAGADVDLPDGSASGSGAAALRVTP
jgi:hypothetical protein